MKSRVVLITAMLLAGLSLHGQPAETVYEGTLIASGFKQSIPLASDGPFPIGFSFTFFGNTYTDFYISANGLVMFTDPDDLYNTEATIPTASMPNNYIAPFWDNLSITSGGNILYRTIGAAPNRKCIIQFKNMGFDPTPSPLGTFFVILYETSNIIQVQYRLLVDPFSAKSHGESATIGLENSDGSSGVLFAYHGADAVNIEDAISFTPSGLTYTVNNDAVYDGVFLTTNLTLPDPSIVSLMTPSADAVIGTDQTFEWSAATNATSYYLVIDISPDLSTATYYNTVFTSYDVIGLTLDETYYWAVFSTNATGITWCEVRRFTTTSIPPLAPVPLTVWTEQGQDKTIKLNYTGGDASPKTAIITSLPAQGQLYQYNAGIRGSQITSVPATVTDAAMNVIYAASGSAGNGVGNFNFKINDAGGDSPEATITVNVSPPGVPNVLYIAKSTNVEIQLDMIMADPTGKQSQFEVKVNGTPVTINSVALKTGDPYTIVLNLATPLAGTETVLCSYTPGDVISAVGGFLLSFTDESVTLTAQTINFAQSLTRKYNESPLTLTATASSGLGMTYSSSNPSVATASGNKLTFHSLGTSEITARQSGNTTYAPAKFIKTLTVSKGDQTITFDPLPDKTYGDADFNLTATASSGLVVTYSSDNTTVATIVSNMIHIAATGTTMITASQPGNDTYNAASNIQQNLTVNKADLTFTADDISKDYGAAVPSLTYTISGFVYGETQSVLDVLPSIQTTAQQNSPPGDYPITLSGGNDNNYSYSYVPGTLTIILIPHKNIMYLFTPNNDGINDYWVLPDMDEWGKCDVRVFNRWGKLVFADDNYDNLWDGVSNGNPLPEGAYYFVIKTQNAGTITGTVNIVR